MMSNRSLLFLDEIDRSHAPLVGSKAATLGWLRQNGLPIPNGFVIPVTIFRAFIDQAGLAPMMTEVDDLARTRPDEVDGSAAFEQLVDAFSRGQRLICDSIEARRAFSALIGETGAVAVRSSAIGEDGSEASYAGQHQSVLNVRSFPDLLQAIWRCWGSLFSRPAVRYRARFAPNDPAPAMAVLVQTQVVCDAAGTLFTADPLNGTSRIIIDATWGLGEAIAQGEVVPDCYRIDRDSLADAEPPRIGDKRCQRVLADREGTRLAPVPIWRRQGVVLSASQRSALALLGLQVEGLLDSALDVEWGLAGGRWWIFQARPITARPRLTAEDEPAKLDAYEWTSGFLDERLIEPVSPLGWSVLRASLEDVAFREPLRMLGIRPSELGPLTRLWNGHPYVNVAVFAALYKLFPDWLLPEDARRFFPGGDLARRKDAPRPRSVFAPEVWPGLLRTALNDPLVVSPLNNESAWNRFERQYRFAMAALSDRIAALEPAPPDDLTVILGLLDEVERRNRRLLEIHRWSLTHAEIWYSLLRRLASRLLGPQAAAYAAAAVRDLDDRSMHLNRALLELARFDDTDGEAFQTRLQNFLIEYGHRSFSLDLLRPGFAAEPAQVIGLVRALRAPPGEYPRSTAAPTPIRSLQGRLAYWLLSPLARITRRYARLREDQRFTWQRGLALMRRLYLIAGRILCERGSLQRAEDVFFLTADEVRAARARRSNDQELVRQRARRFAEDNARYAGDPRANYPAFLRGNTPLWDLDSRIDPTEPGPRTGAVLRGEPVSPGIGRGRARVIQRAADLPQIQPGEVLVARGADPGWTVVFEGLAGLVTESGGQLSHAAVAAREYHLPAVLAVPRATQLIRTGDEIIVDGATGQVRQIQASN